MFLALRLLYNLAKCDAAEAYSVSNTSRTYVFFSFCSSCFFLNFLLQWIYDPSSDGCCPTCKTSYLNHLPTPPPEYSRYQHQSDSDSSSSDEEQGGESTPPTSADESSPVIPSKSRSASSTGVDEYTYERIISIIGLTVVMCILVGYT